MNKLGVVVLVIGGEITIKLINDLVKFVDIIVLIDDKCPLKTGEKVKQILTLIIFT